MKAYVELEMNASKEAIWNVISDIENSEKHINAIMKIEVLEKPDDMLGFKWRETRMMFGKEATEVMWITDYEENKYYKTRAESHGAVYISTLTIKELGDSCILGMGFEGVAVSFLGKAMNVIFGKMMMKSTEKALSVDLEDIKKKVEDES